MPRTHRATGSGRRCCTRAAVRRCPSDTLLRSGADGWQLHPRAGDADAARLRAVQAAARCGLRRLARAPVAARPARSEPRRLHRHARRRLVLRQRRAEACCTCTGCARCATRCWSAPAPSAADDPQLTTRRVAGANPVRVVLDPPRGSTGARASSTIGRRRPWWVCDEHARRRRAAGWRRPVAAPPGAGAGRTGRCAGLARRGCCRRCQARACAACSSKAAA